MTLICGFLTGCAGRVPSPSNSGTQIPRDCEHLAANVPGPQWRKGDNPKILLGRTTVSLHKANNNLDATRNCQKRQRELFAR